MHYALSDILRKLKATPSDADLSLDKSQEGNSVASYILANPDSYKLRKDGELTNVAMEFINSIKGFDSNLFASDLQQKDKNVWQDEDHRIISISIKNFRGFSTYNSSDKYPFGINFTAPQSDGKLYGCSHNKNNKETESHRNPSSMILLGANGCGKTSLYSAIEASYLGDSAVAKKHKIGKQDLVEYYSYLGNSSLDTNVTILSLNGNTKTVSPIEFEKEKVENVDLRPFFCSESDISMFECSGDSVEEYVNSLTGIAELNRINTFLKKVKELLEEKREGEGDGVDNPSIYEIELHESMLSRLHKDVAVLINDIGKKINEIQLQVLPEIQVVLDALLSEYTDDVVELSYRSLKNGENSKKAFNGFLRRKTIEEGRADEIDPRNYFNNFRFKLYLISIRIAIAMYIMKSRNLSFPLVFDDVFDSSDFGNRVKTADFFEKIFRHYDDLEISDRPLQLIFFTQDEVIAESIYRGVVRYIRENKVIGSDDIHVALVRLFKPEEAKDCDILKNDNGYVNLYDIIENY